MRSTESKTSKSVNVNFMVSEELIKKINLSMETWGFATRAEFFRFCAIDFLRTDSTMLSADETFNKYAKAIHSVKAAKWLAKRRIY